LLCDEDCGRRADSEHAVVTKKKGKKTFILKKTHTILIRATSTFDPATADAASISAQTK
jgi:hypothetical protein